MSWLTRLFHREPEASAADTAGATLEITGERPTASRQEAAQADAAPIAADASQAVHRVLISENRQGRFYGGQGIYSVWPLDQQAPAGWTDTGFTGSREECDDEASRLGIAPIDIQKYYEVRRWRGATHHFLFGTGVVRWLEIIDALNNLPRQLTEARGSGGPQPTVPELLYAAMKRERWVELALGGGGDGDAGTPLVYACKDQYMDWTCFAVAWHAKEFRRDLDVDRLYRLDELSGRSVPAIVLLTASRELQALMKDQSADPSLVPDLTDEDLLPMLDAGDFRGARPVMLFVAKPALWAGAGAAPS